MTIAADFGTLDRRVAVKELLRERGEALVVSGLGSASNDVFAAGDCDANFYLWGAMGGAAMIGLGLALAQPQRAVVVVTGDGEQLMGLGALATVAIKRPPNLSIVVLDNGHFGETGGQLSHSGLGLSLYRIAEATGFASAVELRDLAQIADYRPMLVSPAGGPRFVSLRIAAGQAPRMPAASAWRCPRAIIISAASTPPRPAGLSARPRRARASSDWMRMAWPRRSELRSAKVPGACNFW